MQLLHFKLLWVVFVLQPIDVILSHDIRQIVALLEYVRYDPLPQIQRYSVQIMKILRLPTSLFF